MLWPASITAVVVSVRRTDTNSVKSLLVALRALTDWRGGRGEGEMEGGMRNGGRDEEREEWREG